MGKKRRLWQVLCLLMCVVAHSGGDDTENRLGVLGGDVHPGLDDDAGRSNDPDFRETVSLDPDPQLPILDSEHPSQPVIPATGDRDIPPIRSETSRLDTDQEKAQGTEGQAENDQVFDSAKAFNVLDSNQNEADDTNAEGLLSPSSTNAEVGNNQLPEDKAEMRSHVQDNPDALNTHSSEKEADMGVLGAMEGSIPNNNVETGIEEETEGQAQNGQGDDGYLAHDAQSSRTDETDVSVLGGSPNLIPESDMDKKVESQQENEGQVQQNQADESSQVLNTQSSHTNEADVGVLGNTGGPFSENKAETERKIETNKNQLDAGVLGTSYIRPSSSENVKLNQGGNVLDSTGNLISSSFRRPAVPSENVEPNGNNGGVDLNEDQRNNVFEDDDDEDQRNNNFEGDNRHEDKENTQVPNVFKGSGDDKFRDDSNAIRDKNVYPSLENQHETSAADGSNMVDQQPQLDNKPDWVDDEVDQLDDDGNEIPWLVNPFDKSSSDKQTEEKGADTDVGDLLGLFRNKPDVQADEEEEEDDFGDDYYDDEDEDDDWWYYNPDSKKGNEGKTAQYSTWPSTFFFSSSTSTPPADAAQEGEGAKGEKEGKEPPDIHEGVIEITDLKKNVNGPKESILLYTALIVIFIVGIVIFTLWKNASKTSRSKNPMATVSVGEEGKRLLDHPFV